MAYGEDPAVFQSGPQVRTEKGGDFGDDDSSDPPALAERVPPARPWGTVPPPLLPLVLSAAPQRGIVSPLEVTRRRGLGPGLQACTCLSPKRTSSLQVESATGVPGSGRCRQVRAGAGELQALALRECLPTHEGSERTSCQGPSSSAHGRHR